MDLCKENVTITNCIAAQTFLKNYFHNDPIYHDILNELNNHQIKATHDFNALIAHIANIINANYNKLIIHTQDESFNINLRSSLECLICTKLHDYTIGLFYQGFHKEDQYLFNKIMELNSRNVSIEQIGGSKKYIIPIHAAIVELSNLDGCKNPIEKFICIQTALDMVYAQVKSELAEINKDEEETESIIPVIETEDVFSILIVVIIKAKLQHIYSNIVYIEELSSKPKREDKHFRNIMNVFCDAIERIGLINIDSLPMVNCNIEKEMPYISAMQLINENKTDNDIQSPFLNHHIERIKQLINSSVNT